MSLSKTWEHGMKSFYIMMMYGLWSCLTIFVLLENVNLSISIKVWSLICVRLWPACYPHGLISGKLFLLRVWDGSVVEQWGAVGSCRATHHHHIPSILLEAGRHVASRGSVQSVLLENLRLNIKGGLEREPGRWSRADSAALHRTNNNYISDKILHFNQKIFRRNKNKIFLNKYFSIWVLIIVWVW